MKKHIIRFAAIIAAASSFIARTKEELNNENVNNAPAIDGVEFVLNLNPGTKTANDGLSTVWVEGDKVNVFNAVAGTTDYVDDGAFEFNSGTKFTRSLISLTWAQ